MNKIISITGTVPTEFATVADAVFNPKLTKWECSGFCLNINCFNTFGNLGLAIAKKGDVYYVIAEKVITTATSMRNLGKTEIVFNKNLSFDELVRYLNNF